MSILTPPKTPPAVVEFLEQFGPASEKLARELHEVREQLASTNGILRRGPEARAVTGVSRRLWTSAGQLAGLSLRETSGTNNAVVRLRDGIDASGDLITSISLIANESTRDWFLPHGIAFTVGLYVEIVSGAVEGAIYGRQA